jgi:hypothetical protein
MFRYAKILFFVLAAALLFAAIYDCFLLKPDEWQPLKRGYPISQLPSDVIVTKKDGLTVGSATRKGILGSWSLTISTHEGEISNVYEAYNCRYTRFLGRARNR